MTEKAGAQYDSRCCDIKARTITRHPRSAKHRRGDESNDERGAVLILALVYLVSIGLVVTALASWASNDLNNTTTFNTSSELHYALSSATNTAIQSIRYSPQPSSFTPTQKQATPLGNCWPPTTSNSTLTINTYSVTVWCSTFEDNSNGNGNTRTVTFYACLSSSTAVQCQSAPRLTAVVVFDDYPLGGGVRLNQQCNLGVGQCGYSQTLISWIWT
jgi:hypothetical protein